MTYLRRRKQQALTTNFVANTANFTTTNTVADITNTEMTFTPPVGNFQYVVYQYSIQYYMGPSSWNDMYYELQEKIGSGNYSPMGDGYRIREFNRYGSLENIISGRFLVPIYSGTRSYKLTIRGNTYFSEFNRTYDNYKYSPIVQMYCI